MLKEFHSKFTSEVLQYRICKIALREDQILHIDIKSDEQFGIDDFKDCMAGALELGKGRKFANLITVGKYTLADHAAREASTKESGCKYKTADAFVISSVSQKLIANFYMNFHKPFAPTRFFNNVDDAIKWVKKYV